MQEHWQEPALVNCFADLSQRSFLRWVEQEFQLARLQSGDAEPSRFFAELDNASSHQGLQRGPWNRQPPDRRHVSLLLWLHLQVIDDRLLVRVEFAVDGFQRGDLDIAASITHAAQILTSDPLLTQQSK